MNYIELLFAGFAMVFVYKFIELILKSNPVITKKSEEQEYIWKTEYHFKPKKENPSQ